MDTPFRPVQRPRLFVWKAQNPFVDTGTFARDHSSVTNGNLSGAYDSSAGPREVKPYYASAWTTQIYLGR